MKCSNCNQPVHRNPSQAKRSKSGNVFCSRSCAAVFNNKMHPKRQYTNSCVKCKCPITRKAKYCGKCYKNFHYLDDKTLAEATANRQDGNRYCNIRQSARTKYLRSDKPKKCAECGYDVHIEVCHIRDIADFPPAALIREINHLDNLIALCRNHHWEMDHQVDPPGLAPGT